MNRSHFLILALVITLLMGVTSTSQALSISFTSVSDTVTPIPGGSGNFTSFLGAPSISFGNLAFVGTGSDGQVGVYVLTPPDPIMPVADTSTAIPNGTGNFVNISAVPCISGNNVVFVGTGTSGQVGVYVLTPPDPIIPVADINTPIPGGSGNFVSLPADPCINGGNVVFVGTGSGGQQGVYILTPPDPIMPVADTSTPIPSGLAAFRYFTTVAMDSANNVAFVGGEPLDNDVNQEQGVYKLVNGSLLKVADLTTAIPGGAGNFARFGSVAIDPGTVVFEGFDASLRNGLYSDLGGTLSKVIAEGDTLGGKTVSGLRFQRSGFSDGQVAFVAEFSDASQGIFFATLSQAPCPLSQGYWKNNPAQWPLALVTLGSQTYSKAELLAILKNSTSSDASIILARQLIAAKLNIAVGSDPAPVSGTISHADGLLGGFTGKLPYKVKTNSTTGAAMVNDATVLNSYNNVQLTPDCTP